MADTGVATAGMRWPRVVLLHGWGGTFASSWRSCGMDVALAAADHDAIGVDLPGHGPGPHPHDPGGYSDLATAVIQRLPDGEVVDGVGFSLGAKILLEIACREPARFRRLVLCGLGANVFAPEPAGAAVADALEHGIDAETAPAVRELVESGLAAGNDPMAIAACLRRPPNPILAAERLAAIRCPTLLISGDDDNLVHPLSRLADVLPTAEVVTLPGATHLGLLAEPSLGPAVLRFLEQERSK